MNTKSEIAISIIIPVYNAEKTIEQCLSSILRQDFSDYEIIIIDDGSLDRTTDVVKKKQAEDTRIHLYKQNNRGVSSARNTGLKYASGKYVMFIDGDDYITDSYLEEFYTTIEQSNADIVIGGCTKYDISENNKTIIVPSKIGDITTEIWEYLSLNIPIYGYICSKIINREVLVDNNISFNEKMYSQEDLRFNIDVYSFSKRIITIKNTGYVYVYQQSGRKPAVLDYIDNKIRLYDICLKKSDNKESVKKNIRNTITGYIFGIMYNTGDSEKMDLVIQQLSQMNELNNILTDQKITNEKTYVTKLLVTKRYILLKAHFILRKYIKRIVNMVKK